MPEAPKTLHKVFRDVLMNHVGKEFTVVNPESYEETAVGHHLRAGWYPCKLAAIGDDFVVLVGRFQHGGGKHAKLEPMEQYVPIAHIKRISLMHSERLLHI